MKSNLIRISILISFAIVMIVTGYFTKNARFGLVIFVSVLVLSIGILAKMHSKESVYICNKCGKKFKISFLQDLLSLHNVNKKYLRCPYCNNKDWHEEVI